MQIRLPHADKDRSSTDRAADGGKYARRREQSEAYSNLLISPCLAYSLFGEAGGYSV
jgi:hypothetical protein